MDPANDDHDDNDDDDDDDIDMGIDLYLISIEGVYGLLWQLYIDIQTHTWNPDLEGVG